MAKNSVNFSINLQGVDEFRHLLRELPAATEVKVLANAVAIAARPVQKKARQLVPVATGALKRSITTVVRRGRNGVVTAYIGPDRDYYREGKRVRKKDSKRGADKPANYAHLVEFGHRIAKGGKLRAVHKKELIAVRTKDGKLVRRWRKTSEIAEPAKGRAAGHVPPRPFIRPALEGQRQLVESSLGEALAKGIAREVKRIKKSNARRGI